jgi:hypothetical protein
MHQLLGRIRNNQPAVSAEDFTMLPKFSADT